MLEGEELWLKGEGGSQKERERRKKWKKGSAEKEEKERNLFSLPLPSVSGCLHFGVRGERNDQPAEIHERRGRGVSRGEGKEGEKKIKRVISLWQQKREGVSLLFEWSMKLVQHLPPTGSKLVE